MARKTTVTDEEIVTALMAHGTQREAAAAVGLDERTVYNRMNTGEFQAVYRSAKAEILRNAVSQMNRQLLAAIDTIAAIMTDPKVNAAVRLQAATTLINNAGKFAERLQTAEQAVTVQIESNHYGYR